MTALRVVTDHNELENIGTLTHNQLDSYTNSTLWLVASSSTVTPPSAKRLIAGLGVSISIGSADVTITAVTQSFSWNEIPAGNNDGINKQFVLAHAPINSNSLMFFVNGVKQRIGIDSDFTVTGSIINLNPNFTYHSGSNIDATYTYY